MLHDGEAVRCRIRGRLRLKGIRSTNPVVVGDQVTCPKKGHGGTTVIVSGDPTMIIDGQPAARHGDMCACGATLISGQAVSTGI